MRNSEVDRILEMETRWRNEFEKLRSIAMGCQLKEEVKWGSPCYTFNGKNIVLIHGFKEYCAYLLFKGSLLDDPDGILVQQTSNVQAARQIRFTGLEDIISKESVLISYIGMAIKIEKAGLKVIKKVTSEFPVAIEFREILNNDPALKKAFKSLTPGRQRAYLFYFSSAKLPKTRESRIEKYYQKILDGKGLDD